MTGRDALRDDGTLGVLTNMYHLGTCIGLLIVVGNSYRVELGLRVIAAQNARWVLPGDGTTRFNLRPRQLRVNATQIATLGYQVQHTALTVLVARIPVLNGRVFHLGTVHHDNLNDGGMQLVLVAHRGCTSLQIRYVGIVVGNNQCTLKLTCVTGIDAEVRAELHGAANTLGNINKRTIAEHSRVECCKEVIFVRHYCSQVLTHQVAVLLDGLANRAEDNTLFAQLLLKGGLYRYAIHDSINGGVTTQGQALFKGDT